MGSKGERYWMMLIFFGAYLGLGCYLQAALTSGVIKGVVIAEETGEPLSGANISVGSVVTFSDSDGKFRLAPVKLGTVTLEVSLSGWHPVQMDGLHVEPDSGLDITVKMTRELTLLKEMVVTPSHFSIMQQEPVQKEFLDREAIRNTPHLGDDIYRSVNSLPGTSSEEISAKFTIRGGESREILVLLDGMELVEPFHLKDFTGVFSIVDAEAIGGLDMTTGGFSAQHGNKMSGIFDMKSVTPTERKTSLSMSFGGSRLMTEGTFHDSLGQYMFSFRRGYLDILLDLAGEDDDLSPKYWDSFAKVQYALGETHSLSFNYLLADDSLEVVEEEDEEEGRTSYGSGYYWIGLHSLWSDQVNSRTLVYYGSMDRDRRAYDQSGSFRFDVNDQRAHSYYGLKQDWEWELSSRNIMKFGFKVQKAEADYDYFGERFDQDPILGPAYWTNLADLSFSGNELGVYAIDRIRLTERLVAEIGLRYDRQSYLDKDQLSPRLNLVYTINEKNSVRAAWGHFYQPQAMYEIQVADGLTTLALPELAEHYLLAYDCQFANQLNIRIEGYYKKLKDLHTRYENIFDTLEAFPELEYDRFIFETIAGEAKGVELVLRKDTGGRFSWMANYALTWVEDEIHGEPVPRKWDQRHAVNTSLNFRKSEKWNVNLAWHYHTGWRTTDLFLNQDPHPGDLPVVLGPMYDDTFDDYHRLDMRINRDYLDEKGKGFTFFLDITNVYDRKNVRGYGDIWIDHNGEIFKEEEDWLPMLPSLGFNWTF